MAFRFQPASILFCITSFFCLLFSAVHPALAAAPPAAPIEFDTLASQDADYDSDGNYRIAWAPPAGQAVKAYQLAERRGPSGAWVLLSQSSGRVLAVRGRAHGTRYFYRVRAQSRTNAWGPWSRPSDGILVDRTPPQPPVWREAAAPSLSRVRGSWTQASDPESGLQSYVCELLRGSANGPVVRGWSFPAGTAGLDRSGLSLAQGQNYFVRLQARNQTGLLSTRAVWGPFAAGGVGEGEGGGNAVLLQAEDSPSLDTTRDGFVVPMDVLQIVNHLNSVGAGPTQPATERLDVNKDGWIVPMDSLIVINFLNSGQSVVALQLSVSGPDFSSPTEALVAWSLGPAAQNQQIVAYRWRLVTSSGTTAWTSQTTSSVRFTPQTLPAGAATLEIQAQHSATYWSGTIRHRFTADWTAPSTPVVTDDGAATGSTTQLHAAWTASDPESGVAEYQYQILQDSVSGPVVVAWTSAGTQTSVTRTGLNLTMGKSYFFAARARNRVGVLSFVGFSDGITVQDSTPPTAPAVTDDGATTGSTTQLHATWTASSDPESGVAEYQYQILQDSVSGSVVVPWASAGAQTSVTKTGLNLAMGKNYFFAVRAKNGAGVYSSIGYSDGILVRDSTPPTAPVVTDDGAMTGSTTQLHATWIASSDPESGITEYLYQITRDSTSGPVIAAWASAGTQTSVTVTGLNLVSGKSYFFSVSAKNGEGMFSATGYSDGIAVDSTPPTLPAVTDDGATTSSTTQLHATWTASSDPESGVTEYLYQIARDSTYGSIVVEWRSTGLQTSVTVTGLNLAMGKSYFFAVRAKNGAGAFSSVAYSDGIMVEDPTPPTVPVVTDDGSTTDVTTKLHAAWTASSDPESGIAEYQYQISEGSISGPVVRAWTSAGTQTSVTATGLNLARGKSYFFAVRAKNNAEGFSLPGYSDGISIPDRTPPTRPQVISPGIYTSHNDRLSASWSSSDPESGVAEYRYQIIRRGVIDTTVVDWTSTGTATQVTHTDLSLVEGGTYLFAVQARNGDGLWSESGFSGSTVDTIPPLTPVVSDEGDFTADRTQLRASWESNDAVSGVTGYEYAIGTTSGSDDVAGWTSTGRDVFGPIHQVTRAGLLLNDGVRYYFSVKATDGAGHPSYGFSDGITADASPPSPPQVADDGTTAPSRESLHARWSGAEDIHSGIVEYQYQIAEGAPAGAVVSAWASTGTATEVTHRSPALLKDGPVYYISVKARNGSGLWSPVGSSDGISVGNEAPVLAPIGDKQIHVFAPPPAAGPTQAPVGGSSSDARQLLFLKVTPLTAPRMGAVVRSGQRLRRRGSPYHLRRILRQASPVVLNLNLEELCCRNQAMRATPVFPPRSKAARSALGQVFRLEMECRPPDLSRSAQEFLSNPQVLYCEPPMKVKLFQTTDDPYLASSGSWAQPYGDLWGLHRIQAPAAWDLTAGSPNIVVAVVDTGVDPDHADLFPNLWNNTREIPGNGRDDDANGYVDDVSGWDFVSWDDDLRDPEPSDGHGHGTHVAGTIAAVGNNGQGIVGVAWKCKVMPLKGLDDSGSGTSDDLAAAIAYAVDNGARVINMSWGGGGTSQLLEDVIRYAHGRNVVCVAAAGNSNTDAYEFTPANIREAITVAASDPADHKPNFSNYGPKIDVAAPGGGSTDNSDTALTYVNILSCRARGTDMYEDGQMVLGQYARARGTSMAAPHVAGLCALILSRHPEFKPEEVRKILRFTADDIEDPLDNGTRFIGPDIYTGAGRINAARAVTVDLVPLSVVTAPGEWASVSGLVQIVGHASSSKGFLRYRLEEAEGLNPSTWRLLKESTSPVTDGVLGTWDTLASTVGAHLLRLTVWVQDLPQGVETIVPVQVTPPMLRGWPKRLDLFSWGYSFEEASVMDVDQDGRKEFVTNQGRRFSLEGALLSQPVLPRSGFPGVVEAMQDLTGDGRPEFLISQSQTSFPSYPFPERKDYAMFELDGALVQGWPRSFPDRQLNWPLAWTSPRIGDADGDGVPEIAFGISSSFNGESVLYVLKSDGSPFPGWPKQFSGALLNEALAWVDLDGDGKSELAVGVNRSTYPQYRFHVEFYSGNGDLLSRWESADSDAYFRLFLGVDLDADGKEELIGIAGHSVYAWKAPGELLPGWPIGSGFVESTVVTLADLDGDGRLEVIAAGGIDTAQVAAWRLDGSLLPGWPAYAPGIGTSVQRTDAHFGAVDLDGDRFLDLVVSGESVCTSLTAIRNDGQILPGWPIDLRNWDSVNIISGPLFFDRNGDGRLEIGLLDRLPSGSVQALDRIWILNADGQPYAGWPVGTRARLKLGQAVDVDGNGDVELFLPAQPVPYGADAPRSPPEYWAFDLPGAGFSRPPPDPVSVKSVARAFGPDPYYPWRADIYPRPFIHGERGLLEIRLKAEDKNRDRLTFAAQGIPSGAVFKASQGLFLWRPTASQGGNYRVTFTVSDGSLTDSETITISVKGSNSPPQMTPPQPFVTVNEGEPLEIPLKATDPDGDTVQFLGEHLPEGATLDRRSGRFSWRPGFTQAGEYLFTVSATDGSLKDSRDVRVQVSNVNRPPVLTVPPSPTLNEGQVLEFLTDAVEPDGEDLSLSASGLPDGATWLSATGFFSWQPTFQQSGSYTVQITASDGALSVTRDLVISVRDAQPWTTAPVVPVISLLPEETNQPTLTISGTKPAYTAIFINGIEVVARDRLTTWSATVPLSEGRNSISVQTVDVAGLSSFVVQRLVVLDRVPPILTVTSPIPGQVVSLTDGSGGT